MVVVVVVEIVIILFLIVAAQGTLINGLLREGMEEGGIGMRVGCRC